VNEDEVTNFTYGETYILTCISKGSRPSIELNLYNNQTNLEEYVNNTVSNVQRKLDCNQNSICTTILSLSLTFNDERLRSSNQIICEAKNTTKPYELSVNSTIFVTINDQKGKNIKIKFHFH
jgi:hypothetical protein